MFIVSSPLTGDQVLRAFHHDQPYLFLSAAFITVAVVSALFSLLRRRFDPLLIFLAIFAYLYGQRLRLDSEVLRISLSHSEFFVCMRTAMIYLVPIPAFGFFEAAGFLGRRGKTIVAVFSLLFLGLVTATLIFGPLDVIQKTNSILVIIALLGVTLRSYLLPNPDRDFSIIRAGLLCFVIPSIWDNAVGAFLRPSRIEPYGFAIFLASLGYVAARRTLRRDHELSEMRNEMELARRIQLSILPAAFPESARFSVAARYVPMTSVAGDFYDFLSVEADQAGILIADVSGHGVPAALIASMVKMAATSQRVNAAEPANLLAGMNAALCGNTQHQFVTAAYVHLDAHARELRYAAAGHPPMLLLRNGQISEIIENGLMLAITESATYTQLVHPFEPGDRLILYTDGILEARDTQGNLFGEENLHAAVRHTAKELPAKAADQIIESIQRWAKSQDDDLTVLVCDFAKAS